MCLDAMSIQKLKELARRIGVPSTAAIQNIDPSQDAETWRSFLGFFGADWRTTVSYKADLDQEQVLPQFSLFPHQRNTADRVSTAIRDRRGRVVLHMPTGAGKTRTTMHVVCHFLASIEPCVIIWLANSAELLDQAADAFQTAWSHLGNREVNLLRFWGDHAPALSTMSDGLVVAGLQKMHALRTSDWIAAMRFARKVSLVVVDEAHQAIAPSYRELIEMVANTGTQSAIVGLTATPGRTWSDIASDAQLSRFFNEQKVMLEVEGWKNPVAFLIEEGYLARPHFQRLEIEASPIPKSSLSASSASSDYEFALLDNLAKQVNRNIAIINETKRLIEAGHRRIILFGASVRHAEVLAAALTALEIDARVVTGETASTTRARTITAFRGSSPKPMILCNFGVLTTGFDAPNTSAAIIARPTKSLVLFSQMVGRATRGPKAGGNENCEITTVVDIDLVGFGDIADAFTNWEDVWHDNH